MLRVVMAAVEGTSRRFAIWDGIGMNADEFLSSCPSRPLLLFCRVSLVLFEAFLRFACVFAWIDRSIVRRLACLLGWFAFFSRALFRSLVLVLPFLVVAHTFLFFVFAFLNSRACFSFFVLRSSFFVFEFSWIISNIITGASV